MSGEKDLGTLLASMAPKLLAENYIFTTFTDKTLVEVAQFNPVGTFVEKEGLTAILPVTDLVLNEFDTVNQYRCITLNVHSSLDAVGLTAAVANALANEGISANVVAAYYHDHIFVNANDGQRAQQVLMALSKSYR